MLMIWKTYKNMNINFTPMIFLGGCEICGDTDPGELCSGCEFCKNCCNC